MDHDVLALEVAMDDGSGLRVDSLRETMELLVDGGPVPDLELAEPGDEAVEKVRRLPPEIVVVEDPCPQERALVDVTSGRRVERHEAHQDAAIDALDARRVMGKLEVRVERSIAEILEQRALVHLVRREERGHRDGVTGEEARVREMPFEVRVLRAAFHQHRRPAVASQAEVPSVRSAQPDENGVGPEWGVRSGRRSAFVSDVNREMPREEGIAQRDALLLGGVERGLHVGFREGDRVIGSDDPVLAAP